MRERGATATRDERSGAAGPRADAARKRAAVELIARHERALMRTARRFSLDDEDAEDAYQRALEILLIKAPTTDPRQLIRWTQTVTRHEALAVRASREKALGSPGAGPERLASVPSDGEGPEERAARREIAARSREALRALKPAELRALSLLAGGYSYAEIGELTGFSRTKVNRVLAEGRERFRALFADSEDGSRCRELRPLLSAFCDGEASAEDATAVREHLRACAGCRATVRAYRAAPRAAAALAPALPLSRSLLERLAERLGDLRSRLPGAGGATDSGAGVAALAKLAVVCAGVAGGACLATGTIPSPLAGGEEGPTIERGAERPTETPPEANPGEAGTRGRKVEAEGAGQAPTGAVEPEPPPVASEPEAPAPSAPESAAPAPSGSAAGEFGP